MQEEEEGKGEVAVEVEEGEVELGGKGKAEEVKDGEYGEARLYLELGLEEPTSCRKDGL